MARKNSRTKLTRMLRSNCWQGEATSDARMTAVRTVNTSPLLWPTARQPCSGTSQNKVSEQLLNSFKSNKSICDASKESFYNSLNNKPFSCVTFSKTLRIDSAADDSTRWRLSLPIVSLATPVCCLSLFRCRMDDFSSLKTNAPFVFLA